MDLTTPPEGYTPEEWEGLSDDEKEGIIDGIENPEGDGETSDDQLSEEDLKKIAGEEEPPKAGEPPKADEPPKPPEEPAAPPAKKEDEPPAPDKKTDELVADEDLLKYRAVVTDEELELEEVIPAEMQSKLDELKQKYDDGEMSIHEYSSERDKINRQIFKHNAALESSARSETVWQKEQLHFLKNKPEYLPGSTADATGKIRANALFGALSETIKSLSSDDANTHLSGMQLLVMADGIVKEAFGLKNKPAEKKPEEPKEKKPPAELPGHKTLSHVPAAGKNDEDAFAQLDKLEGEAYEEALEKLPDAVRDAYLSR